MSVNELRDKLREMLVELGYNESEICVFFVLAESNSAMKSSEIARILKKGRMLTYNRVERFAQMGIVKASAERPKKYFMPSLLDATSALQELEESRMKNILYLRQLADKFGAELKDTDQYEDTSQIIFSNIIRNSRSDFAVEKKVRRLARENEEVFAMGQLVDVKKLYDTRFFSVLKGKCRLVISIYDEQKRLADQPRENGQTNILEDYLKGYAGMERVSARVVEQDCPCYIFAGDEALVYVDDHRGRNARVGLRVNWTNSPNILTLCRTNFELVYNNPKARVL
jgi:predicted DNA-binding transcriptional regulator